MVPHLRHTLMIFWTRAAALHPKMNPSLSGPRRRCTQEGRIRYELSLLIIPLNLFIHYAILQTVSTIQAFFLAMLLYPEVAKKAQAELDSVVGTDRIPTFEDRDNLPYINAIVKETIRWHPVAPMGRRLLNHRNSLINWRPGILLFLFPHQVFRM